MKISVAVVGANGKMGSEAVKAITAQEDMVLIGKIGREDDLASFLVKQKPDVVVDLTSSSCVEQHTKLYCQSGVPSVIGTTGLSLNQIEALSEQCRAKHCGMIIAPNFSLGAIVMMKAAQIAAQYFTQAEIIELHHPGKLDSPSGTAIKTAELMNEANKMGPVQISRKEVLPHSRGSHYCGTTIHSVRLPGLVAHQEIIFGDVGETFRIRHDSINRECYMPGILLSIRKVVQLEELIYGLDKII